MKQQLLTALILLSVLLTGPQAAAQVPNWAGATQYGVTTLQSTADATGSTYHTGYFIFSATVGSITLTATGRDAYVAALDPAGSLRWVRQIAANVNGFAEGGRVAVAANGDVLASGVFSGTISFGSVSLTSVGNGDNGYLAAYTAAGAVRWVRRLPVFVTAIVPDGARVLLAGAFEGQVQVGTTWLTSAGSSDLYLASCNAVTGAVQWATRDGGTGQETIADAAVTPNGEIVLCGRYVGTAQLAGTTISSSISTTYLLKCASAGNSQWVKEGRALGQPPYEDATSQSVAVDAAGDIYWSGYFRSPSIRFGTTILSRNSTGADAFMAKYTSTGGLRWARKAGTTGTCLYNDLAVSSTGDVLVGGEFMGRVTFGPSRLANDSIYRTPFVARFAPATGLPRWGRRSNSASDGATCAGLALDQNDNVLLCGNFAGQITFGPTTLNASFGATFYVARLGALTGTTAEVPGLALGVAPNPSATGLWRLTLPITAEPLELLLIDDLGRLVHRARLPAGAAGYDLSLPSLAPGAYWLRIVTGNSSSGHRLVRE